ncbi:hypothetical protein [Nocardia aurantiaca]|uniref:Uncharacterized protein n=1 Tax=Nocardia aurantiaca TaxID=2675850 RepID=A0A6I3KZ77_9NOCA|nr:hypothetical protein [Nocardia aurantiaca]MTE13735.1 hypothetical protein [Nocardia aurantiaca]
MGVIGELFPGKKLEDEGSEDSGGEGHRPRVSLDLDAGVIRVSPAASPAQPHSDPDAAAAHG